jgi:hypothetical protein
LALPALAKHNQCNTPIGQTLISQEKVTVTDACHPLHDQTFLLLHITNHHELEPCCLVEIIPGVERLIPVRQTNLSTSKSFVFSCPLDISSLHNLVTVFKNIEARVEMEFDDGIRGNQQANNSNHSPTESMGYIGCKTANAGHPNDRQSLSTDDRGAETGGEE